MKKKKVGKKQARKRNKGTILNTRQPRRRDTGTGTEHTTIEKNVLM